MSAREMSGLGSPSLKLEMKSGDFEAPGGESDSTLGVDGREDLGGDDGEFGRLRAKANGQRGRRARRRSDLAHPVEARRPVHGRIKVGDGINLGARAKSAKRRGRRIAEVGAQGAAAGQTHPGGRWH